MDSEYPYDIEAPDSKLCDPLGHYLLPSEYVPLAGRHQTRVHKAQPEAGTCVDELHMSLQISVDHEDLVAARMWAGPFPDLLMVLLNVLLEEEGTRDPGV